MFEMVAKLFNTIYCRFVSCFRLKQSVLTKNENENENAYGILPDYEPMNEMSNLDKIKIKIQIPKYQFILLEDD